MPRERVKLTDADWLAIDLIAAGVYPESVYLTDHPKDEDDEIVISDEIDIVVGSVARCFYIYRQTPDSRRFLFGSPHGSAIVIFLKKYLERTGTL